MCNGNIIEFLDALVDSSRCLPVYIDPSLNLTLIQPITGEHYTLLDMYKN